MLLNINPRYLLMLLQQVYLNVRLVGKAEDIPQSGSWWYTKTVKLFLQFWKPAIKNYYGIFREEKVEQNSSLQYIFLLLHCGNPDLIMDVALLWDFGEGIYLFI